LSVLHGYKLVFNVPGLPYVEPGFASVMRVVAAADGTAPADRTAPANPKP